MGSGCYPDTGFEVGTWHLGRDVGSELAAILTWTQGFGGGAGFGARPVLTSLWEQKNYQSKGVGAAPSSGVWGAILTWLLLLARGLWLLS